LELISGDFVDKLNKELDVFRVTFNRRVTYFAAYQNVSDSVSTSGPRSSEKTDHQVTPPTYKVLAEEIKEASEEIVAHETRLGQCQVKSRYLHYLGTKQESDDDLKDDCIICFGSSDDEDGVLLQCGHFFCTVGFIVHWSRHHGS
jgi:E3 ubiquitin-protein ligase SHPRH